MTLDQLKEIYGSNSDCETEKSKLARYIAIDRFCCNSGIDLTQKAVLDFGSGRGELANYFNSRNCYIYSYTGLDLRYGYDDKLVKTALANSHNGDLITSLDKVKTKPDVIFVVSVLQDFSSLQSIEDTLNKLLELNPDYLIITIRATQTKTDNLFPEKELFIPYLPNYVEALNNVSIKSNRRLSMIKINGLDDNWMVVFE